MLIPIPYIRVRFRVKGFTLKGGLQLLINRYVQIRFAQVPERVSTKSFVILIIGNSKSFHLGAQGTFNPFRRERQRSVLCGACPESAQPRWRCQLVSI